MIETSFDWEIIQYVGVQSTQRAKVPGGWIVCHIMWHENGGICSESMVFVPDAAYSWKIDAAEKEKGE